MKKKAVKMLIKKRRKRYCATQEFAFCARLSFKESRRQGKED
jgi:hypothetical protein